MRAEYDFGVYIKKYKRGNDASMIVLQAYYG